MDEQGQIIARFARKYPRLREPHGARNQCRIRSEELAAELNMEGIEATCVWVALDASTPAVVAFEPCHPPVQEHCLVRVASQFVDFTRRQFDPTADVPRVYESLAELGRDWTCISWDDRKSYQRITA